MTSKSKNTKTGGGEKAEKKAKTSKTKHQEKKRNLSVSKSQTSTDQKEPSAGNKTVEEPKPVEKKKTDGAKGNKKKELKIDATQEDVKPGETSGMDVLVKEDKKVKMDDGYEDFGPGAQQ